MTMTHRERMLRGLPYRDWMDGLKEERELCRRKLYELNSLAPDDRPKIPTLVKALFGKTGEKIWLEPPFYCDYGWNIFVGENFTANFGLTILDVGRVTVGDNFLAGPHVRIYTAGHPVHPESRKSGYEYGIPVTVGNNVWLGGGCTVLPGTAIGDNAVIGAGSVVTKDVPANVIAAGNPCRVVREITDADRKYYFKDRVFDVDDY